MPTKKQQPRSVTEPTYAPVETRVLTPEQAAAESANPPASSVDHRHPVKVMQTPVTGEVVNDENYKGLPIASSGDNEEYYTQVTTSNEIDYKQVKSDNDKREKVEK